jgi:hypothetical protein
MGVSRDTNLGGIVDRSNSFEGAGACALAPLGVKTLDMPATSERIWQAMREACA